MVPQFVMAGHSRPKDGVAFASLRPAIHDLLIMDPVIPGRCVGIRPGMTEENQHAFNAGPSPTISGCRASDTAGDVRIISACTAKIAAAR